MVTADAQYLSIQFLEPAMMAPEQDGLLGSATGKIQHVERQDHMLCAAKLTQRNIAVIDGRERKVRSRVTDFCWHCASFALSYGGNNHLAKHCTLCASNHTPSCHTSPPFVSDSVTVLRIGLSLLPVIMPSAAEVEV
jgi:hypothetical protein